MSSGHSQGRWGRTDSYSARAPSSSKASVFSLLPYAAVHSPTSISSFSWSSVACTNRTAPETREAGHHRGAGQAEGAGGVEGRVHAVRDRVQHRVLYPRRGGEVGQGQVLELGQADVVLLYAVGAMYIDTTPTSTPMWGPWS